MSLGTLGPPDIPPARVLEFLLTPSLCTHWGRGFPGKPVCLPGEEEHFPLTKIFFPRETKSFGLSVRLQAGESSQLWSALLWSAAGILPATNLPSSLDFKDPLGTQATLRLWKHELILPGHLQDESFLPEPNLPLKPLHSSGHSPHWCDGWAVFVTVCLGNVTLGALLLTRPHTLSH